MTVLIFYIIIIAQQVTGECHAIFELASQLEKEGMNSLLATKIDSLINQYVLTHQFDAPKSIFDLSRLVKTKASHYKGTAISAIMLGSFLSGGPK